MKGIALTPRRAETAVSAGAGSLEAGVVIGRRDALTYAGSLGRICADRELLRLIGQRHPTCHLFRLLRLLESARPRPQGAARAL